MAEIIRHLTKDDFDGIFSILSRSFPEVEYRNREEQKALFSEPWYRVYGYEKDGVLVGVLAVWELDSVRFGEHLAVDPDCRNGGIGKQLISWYLEQSDRPFVLEVEIPDNDLARRRVGFYQRLGLTLNEFPYLQMPLREGDEPLPLYIMSYPHPVSEADFAAQKREIYARVYHVFEEV